MMNKVAVGSIVRRSGTKGPLFTVIELLGPWDSAGLCGLEGMRLQQHGSKISEVFTTVDFDNNWEILPKEK